MTPNLPSVVPESFRPRIIYMPPAITAREFAASVHLNPEVVRRKIRARIIKASGNPYRINPNELRRFNVDWGCASLLITFLRAKEHQSKIEATHEPSGPSTEGLKENTAQIEHSQDSEI